MMTQAKMEYDKSRRTGGLITLVNVYVEWVVFTRIAGTS